MIMLMSDEILISFGSLTEPGIYKKFIYVEYVVDCELKTVVNHSYASYPLMPATQWPSSQE